MTGPLTPRGLKQSNWYGAKKVLAAALTMPVVNQAVHVVASQILPRRLLHRIPVAVPEVHFRLKRGDTVVLRDPQVDLVAKNVYWGGGASTSAAEMHVLRWLEANAAGTDLFLDIGAYSGLFALLAVKSGAAKAVAFEIVPENFLLLLSNILANDFLLQIEPRLCGIGDKLSSLRMPSMKKLSSRPTSVSLGFGAIDGVAIPVRQIDSFDFNGKMIFKIDVETFEWAVIQGGQVTIARYKPHIICEILPWFAHSREIERFLTPLGYRYFISLDHGLEERASLTPDPAARDWIFLAQQ